MNRLNDSVFILLTMLFVFFPCASNSYAGIGSCGATWKQRLAIPEYVCFDLIGGTLPYAICAAGAVVGYKPVYFGEACVEHDSCYSTAGVHKSKCDSDFRDLLLITCDLTLSGDFRGLR